MSPAQATPSGAAQRLDMLVGKKVETPTKKVSFVAENVERRYDENIDRRYDDNDNDVQDEKLSRLERVERDPNVSWNLCYVFDLFCLNINRVLHLLCIATGLEIHMCFPRLSSKSY